jgi:hypothetical protein
VLTLLYDINNADKHRTIQPVWAFPTRVDLEITDARDCELLRPIGFRRKGVQLQVGAEIAFARARKTGPDPELDVQAKVAAEPAIKNAISLREWQGRLGGLIFQLLREFSDPPPVIKPILSAAGIL